MIWKKGGGKGKTAYLFHLFFARRRKKRRRKGEVKAGGKERGEISVTTTFLLLTHERGKKNY